MFGPYQSWSNALAVKAAEGALRILMLETMEAHLTGKDMSLVSSSATG
jgi:hypothetical protein